ncbi:MAG: glycosyl hydrolase family 18 protein [Candidatus Limnocylindria bacterium]
MRSPTYRLLAICLAMLTLMTAPGVAATEPPPDPPPSVAPEPGSPPSVHAEMLTEYEGVTLDLPVGDKPEPMSQSAAGIAADGSVSALPNGLRREVLGYLPYWLLTSSSLPSLRYDRISTIAYFSVGVLPDGTLNMDPSSTGWGGWTSSHMSGVITKAHQQGVRVVLTVTMMAWNGDYSAMSGMLNDPAKRAALAGQIADAVAFRNADGVNLDFEPMPNSLESQYTTFVREVKQTLLAWGTGSYLTVATTGGAASWDEGYDLAGLTASGAADALMVMAYDFSWSGSARAGGVAPIDSPYILDVREAMRDYHRKVPASKLIWGVPYYGRAWTTTTADQNSRTCASTGECRGATWAPRYVDALEAVSTHGRQWDGTGQVPWYTYWSDTYSAHVQGYYDDVQSLDAKYQMVNANQLGGIGIWTLLMDGTRTDLWGVISRRFVDLPFGDINSSPFVYDIIWLAEVGISNGCGSGQFCPGSAVSREQMASFLARALGLPAATTDHFADDAGSVHEADINRVAEASITLGCASGQYCPSSFVTREQMAAFLHRALAS